MRRRWSNECPRYWIIKARFRPVPISAPTTWIIKAGYDNRVRAPTLWINKKLASGALTLLERVHLAHL